MSDGAERLPGALGIGVALLASFGLAYLIDYAVLLRLLRGASPLAIIAGVARMLAPALGALAGLAAEGLHGEWRRFIPLRFPGPGALLASGVLASSPLLLAALLAWLLGLPRGPCGPLSSAGGLWPLLAVLLYLAGLAAGVTVNMVVALGEEAAWRGMLHTALRPRLGARGAGLLIGLVWGLWHAPLVWEGYNYALPQGPVCPGAPARGPWAVLAFTLLAAALGLLLAGLRERYESVVAPAAGHGTINAVAGLAAMLAGGPRLLSPPAGLLVAIAALLVAPLAWLGVPGEWRGGTRGGSSGRPS